MKFMIFMVALGCLQGVFGNDRRLTIIINLVGISYLFEGSRNRKEVKWGCYGLMRASAKRMGFA